MLVDCGQCSRTMLVHLLYSIISIAWRHGQPSRYVESKALQHGDKILRPGNGNNRIGNSILQDQCPTYNPCKQLTKGHISVCIC